VCQAHAAARRAWFRMTKRNLGVGYVYRRSADIAAQLHKFAEEGGAHRAPTLQETHLLFKTALRAIDELASLERRVTALEGQAARD
jgi:hypothetical protein